MIRLQLSLCCPVNRMSRAAFFQKGSRMVPYTYLSSEYRAKRKRLVAEVWQQLGGKPTPIEGPCQVNITIWPRDKRTADLDAYTKSIYDGLQLAGVVKDDKQFVQGNMERMPTPEFPGRIVVEVWSIANEPTI